VTVHPLAGAPGSAAPVGSRAQRYWRAACALAAAHVLGTTWPPPGRPQRTRTVGHWGCNPGIAWIAGHLADAWTGVAPIQFVVGTGHASSFVFGHHAVAEAWSADRISAACARYGVAGGDPAELFGLTDVPYSGGELGPALAVSQGMASAQPDRLIAVVIGDGECETPSALAAFAHAEVLLGQNAANWLPVVNVNGARMGGRARFDAAALTRLLTGLGHRGRVGGLPVRGAGGLA
jgi:xylulose-5-phosphate/fructose-6-phosphate phosphoketolase